jgi:hypothetical protein
LDIWVDSENSNGLAFVRRPMVTFHVEDCARSVFFLLKVKKSTMVVIKSTY